MRIIPISTTGLLLTGVLLAQNVMVRRELGPRNMIHESAADRIVVQHRTGAESVATDQLFRRHGASRISHHAALGVSVLRVDPARRDDIIKSLEQSGLFNFVEPDYLAHVENTPNDPGFPSQWHLPRIQASQAWDYTAGSSSAPIAMIDSGVDPAHPDLAPKLVSGWNFLAGNSSVVDTMGHGTTTAGAAAAICNNAVGVAGVACSNPIMPLIVMDSTGYATYSAIANAITYAADHGARIVNISIGGTSASSVLQNAVNYAWNKGVVVFASSGNGGLNAPYYPAGCQNVVAVGATDSSDTWQSWSNYGSFLALTAPGLNIYTTQAGGGYTYMSGTSYSSPIAAGVAALVLAEAPSLSASALISLLEHNADDLGAAGWDQYYGYGRVNAYRAVSAAGSVSQPPPPTLAISSPASGATVSGTVTVQGSVTDSSTISQIQLLVDGNVASTVYSSPFAFSWNSNSAANGSHTLSVRSTDIANNVAQASVAVNVNNVVTPDAQPPTVSITNPKPNSRVNGSLTVSASASDNVRVTQVAIYVDGVQYYVGSTAPYSFQINAKKLSSGSHTVTAKAWDAAGNVGSATPVTFQN